MPAQIVYPYSATFNADCTAEVGQAQQVSLSKLTADHALEFTSSVIFDAFTIAEGTSDICGDYVVSYSGGASALKTALMGATNGSSETLEQILVRLLTTEVATDLITLGLHNIVEAEELMDVQVDNDALGDNGSGAMDAVLSSNDVNIVAGQIPYARFANHPAGGCNLNAILESGDSIVFNFTVNSKLSVTPVLQTVVAATGATNTGSAEAAFDSNTKSRTVNLTIYKA